MGKVGRRRRIPAPKHRKLTIGDEFDLIMPLQPKAGFPRENRLRGNQFPVMGRGERLAATRAKATFKAKPAS